MSRRQRFTPALALGLAAALTLAACSSDAGDSADTTAAPAAEPADTAAAADTTVAAEDAPEAVDTTAAPAGGDTTAPAATTDLEFEAADGDVRGFDGTTIKLAGLGGTSLSDSQYGAIARIQRFNDTEEIPGVKIEFTEYADDKMDPATGLSEARRLVGQEQVFGLVSVASTVNPYDYLAQQGVPYFGAGYDFTFCSDEPNAETWAFANNGCLVPDDPSEMPDNTSALFEYVKEKTGKAQPTAALFSVENTSGQNSVKFQSASYAGAGFDVVYAEGLLPTTAISDFSPFAQTLLTSADGDQPDVLICLTSTECVGTYQSLQNAGYTGMFFHSLYIDLFLEPMKGAFATAAWAPQDDLNAADALKQINDDIAAVKPDTGLDFYTAIGYFSADMFIAALKQPAALGAEYITPANVRLAAANQTWEIATVAGPIRYPDSTVMPTPACSAVVQSEGTKWVTIVPRSCSENRWPVEG